MKFRKTIISLGVFTAVLPFFGIPGGWKDALFVLVGLAVAVLGYLAVPEAREYLFGESESESPARSDAEKVMDKHENEEHDPGSRLA